MCEKTNVPKSIKNACIFWIQAWKQKHLKFNVLIQTSNFKCRAYLWNTSNMLSVLFNFIYRAGGSSHFHYLLSRSVLTLKEFLSEKEVARFRPYDVEFLLHPLIQSSSAEQVLGLTLTSTILDRVCFMSFLHCPVPIKLKNSTMQKMNAQVYQSKLSLFNVTTLGWSISGYKSQE